MLCGLAFAPAAFAHHPVISGTFSCDGAVSYTAAAWATSTGLPASRTNSDIRIYYNQLNGAAVVPVQIGNGAFSQANAFSFSGMYNLQASVPSFVTSVRLTAVDVANWGNETAPSGVTAGGTGGESESTVVLNRSSSGCTPPSLFVVKLERVNGVGSFVGGPLSGNVGDTVDYQVTVTAGQTPLTAVTLSDPKCDAGTLSPSGPQSLQANESRVFACSHKLTSADGAVGSYTNTASVTGNGPNETSVSAGPVSVVVNLSTGGSGGGGGGGGAGGDTTTPPSTPVNPPAAAPPAAGATSSAIVSPAKPKPKATPSPKPKPKPRQVFKPPLVKPKPAACYVVSAAPESLTAGSHAQMRLRVTGNSKAISGVRVEVKGAGILKLSGRTNAAGRVTIKLNPRKPGIVVLRPASHPSCAYQRIGIVGAFSPPVTG